MATKFITVSIDIMHDKNLTPNQKFILAEIEQLCSLDDGCFASNRHFAELIGITSQGVSKAINELAKDEYITIDNSQTKRNFGRKITINCGKSAINCGKSSINYSLESKENKTINITINTIVEYLNQKTNKRYNSKSKDAQLIKQLLNKDYKLEDFKLVIDHKVSEWLKDDEMSKFLRPSTLFGSKFDRYLNEAIPTQSKPTRRLG